MAESPQRPPSLTVLLGPQAGREFPLQRLECTLGSDSSCDVCVPTPGVAAVHARLRLTTEGARLVPEPGASGLYRNDDPVINESPLASGDVVWLGPPGEPGSVMLQSRLPADLDRFVAQLSPIAEAEPLLEEVPEPEPLLLEEHEPEAELVEALEPEPHEEAVAEPHEALEPITEPDEGEATIALSVSPFAAAALAPAAEVVEEEEVVDFAATVVDLQPPVAETFEATLVDLAAIPDDLTADAPARFAVEPPPPPAPVTIEEDIEEVVESAVPAAEATMNLAPPAAPPSEEPEYAPTVQLKRMPAATAPGVPAPAAPPVAMPASAAARPAASRPEARPRPVPTPAAPRPASAAASAPRRPASVTARPAAAPSVVAAAPPAAAASKAGLFVGVGLAVAAAVGGFVWLNQKPAPPATTTPAPLPAAPPTTAAVALPPPAAPAVAEEVAEAAPMPAAVSPATTTPASRPAAAARPTPTPARAAAKAAPVTAPAGPDPNQVRAQQLAGWLDKGQAAVEARQFEQALTAYQEALKLEPGNARATGGVAQAEAGAAEARKRFVPGRSYFLAKPSGKAPAGFNTQDVTVANPDYSAQLLFEASPASLHSGVAWQVKVFALNDGKKAIKLENLNAFVTVNGSRGSVPSGLKAREIAAGQRVLVAEVAGKWGEAVKSWSLDIVSATSREETLKGSLSWK